MGSLFDDAAVFKDQNPIGHSDGWKPMGDNDRGPAAGQGAEALEDSAFGHGIERSRRFIQDEDVRFFAHECA